MTATRRIVVTGRVQGVFFRDWTVGEARALGLDGWVRNRADGSVEILARGDAAAVAELVRRCGEGPAAARVADVAVEDSDAAVEAGFRRIGTA